MYEIAQWNGKQELAELDNTTISIDPILLNDAILKLMNEDTTIEDDVIDIDFNFGVKKADRYDYCFALFSEYSIMAEPVIPGSRATLIPVARAIYSRV